MDGGTAIAVALVSVSAIVGLILLGDWIAAAWAELLFRDLPDDEAHRLTDIYTATPFHFSHRGE